MEDDEGFKKIGKRGKPEPTAFTLRDFMVSKSEPRAKTFTRDTSARANAFSSGLVSGRSGLLAREAGDLTPSVSGGEDELLGYNMFELLGNVPEEAGGPVEKCDPLAAHHSGDLKKPSTSQKARAPTSSSSSTASSSLSTMPSRPSTYHIAPSSANIKSKEKEKHKNVTFEEALEEHEKIMEQRQEQWCSEPHRWTQHVQGRLAPTLCAPSEGPTYASTNTQDKDIVYELIEDEAVHYIEPTTAEELLQEQDGQDDQRVTAETPDASVWRDLGTCPELEPQHNVPRTRAPALFQKSANSATRGHENVPRMRDKAHNTDGVGVPGHHYGRRSVSPKRPVVGLADSTGAIGVPPVELLSETPRDAQWEILKSGCIEKCSPCGMLNGKGWWEHGPTLSKYVDLHHQAGTAFERDRHAEDVGRSLGLFEELDGEINGLGDTEVEVDVAADSGACAHVLRPRRPAGQRKGQQGCSPSLPRR